MVGAAYDMRGRDFAGGGGDVMPDCADTYGRGRPIGGEGGEEGSGTIAVVGILACVLLCGGAVLGAVAAHAHTVRVQAIADVAALAGAECSQRQRVLQEASCDACARVMEVAEVNGARLGWCAQSGEDVRAVVHSPWAWGGWEFDVSARARAGPL